MLSVDYILLYGMDIFGFRQFEGHESFPRAQETHFNVLCHHEVLLT